MNMEVSYFIDNAVTVDQEMEEIDPDATVIRNVIDFDRETEPDNHDSSSLTGTRTPKHGMDKALEVLRNNVQNAINQKIDTILQEYIKDHFEPAVGSLKSDFEPATSSAEVVNQILCCVLEDAKRMYTPSAPSVPSSSAVKYPTSPVSNATRLKKGKGKKPLTRYPGGKRRDRADSKKGPPRKHRKTAQPNPTELSHCRISDGNVKAVAPKPWTSTVDKDSIDETTKFVFGSTANKELGYDEGRGRIYRKHPNLFKYMGDREDKQWLFENRMEFGQGYAGFLLLSEDVQVIFHANKRRFDPAVEFTIPEFMLEKVQYEVATLYVAVDKSSQSQPSASDISQQSRASTSAEPHEPVSVAKAKPPTVFRSRSRKNPKRGRFLLTRPLHPEKLHLESLSPDAGIKPAVKALEGSSATGKSDSTVDSMLAIIAEAVVPIQSPSASSSDYSTRSKRQLSVPDKESVLPASPETPTGKSSSSPEYSVLRSRTVFRF